MSILEESERLTGNYGSMEMSQTSIFTPPAFTLAWLDLTDKRKSLGLQNHSLGFRLLFIKYVLSMHTHYSYSVHHCQFNKHHQWYHKKGDYVQCEFHSRIHNIWYPDSADLLVWCTSIFSRWKEYMFNLAEKVIWILLHWIMRN